MELSVLSILKIIDDRRKIIGVFSAHCRVFSQLILIRDAEAAYTDHPELSIHPDTPTGSTYRPNLNPRAASSPQGS